MRPALPCPAAGLPVLPGNPALGALREVRERLLGCLTARGDALLELADAVLCSDRPVRSLVQLSLEPEFRRGHGALYDALAAGRVDDERLFSLLTEVLPPLVDGPEARAWTVGHDVINSPRYQAALTVIGRRDPEHDIQPINLSSADFTRANLTSANLSGADLDAVDFTDANLRGANLTGAELKGVKLLRGNLKDARLANADFQPALVPVSPAAGELNPGFAPRYSDLRAARLVDADLTGVNLQFAQLTQALLMGAILRRAILTGTTLTSADLTRADLTGAVLGDADATGAKLTDANLAGANATDTTLAHANLAHANLAHANLGGRTSSARTSPTRT